MVGDLDIQPDNVRVSVIQLSTNATLVMSMDDFRDDTNLEAAFQRMHFTGGYTDTAKAIDLAVSVASNSSMNNRINKAAKVFVLVGDLRSKNISDAISAAMRAKEMDFEIFVLGVGNLVVGQLKAFASPPTCKHLSLLDSYFELYLSVNQLQKGLCEGLVIFIVIIVIIFLFFIFKHIIVDQKKQILEKKFPSRIEVSVGCHLKSDMIVSETHSRPLFDFILWTVETSLTLPGSNMAMLITLVK